jgi:hypothetical protein
MAVLSGQYQDAENILLQVQLTLWSCTIYERFLAFRDGRHIWPVIRLREYSSTDTLNPMILYYLREILGLHRFFEASVYIRI